MPWPSTREHASRRAGPQAHADLLSGGKARQLGIARLCHLHAAAVAQAQFVDQRWSQRQHHLTVAGIARAEGAASARCSGRAATITAPAREQGPAQLLPYVAPTTDWIRLRRRLPVTVLLDPPLPQAGLFMGADARVLFWR